MIVLDCSPIFSIARDRPLGLRMLGLNHPQSTLGQRDRPLNANSGAAGCVALFC